MACDALSRSRGMPGLRVAFHAEDREIVERRGRHGPRGRTRCARAPGSAAGRGGGCRDRPRRALAARDRRARPHPAPVERGRTRSGRALAGSGRGSDVRGRRHITCSWIATFTPRPVEWHASTRPSAAATDAAALRAALGRWPHRHGRHGSRAASRRGQAAGLDLGRAVRLCRCRDDAAVAADARRQRRLAVARAPRSTRHRKRRRKTWGLWPRKASLDRRRRR